MSARKRNSKGQFAAEYSEEEYPQTYAPKSRDQVGIHLGAFLNYAWAIAKIALVILILAPFIDKLRQKDFLSKGLEYINQMDIGCPKCECPKLIASINGVQNITNTPKATPGDIFSF